MTLGKRLARAWGIVTGARARRVERAALDAQLLDQRKQIAHLEQIVAELMGERRAPDLLPPPELRLHVGARVSAANFWVQGRDSARRVIEVFGREPHGPVLDWGCGSGRTLQWLQAEPAWRRSYRGCDVDPEAVAWLRSRGIEGVRTSGEAPPLPYPDGMFSGLFSFSVLTHIHPERHAAWLQELRRVVKPGSRTYLTFGGASRLDEAGAGPDDRARFRRDGCCFLEREGHYKSVALVSEGFVRGMMSGLFEIEAFRERGYHQMDDVIARAV